MTIDVAITSLKQTSQEKVEMSGSVTWFLVNYHRCQPNIPIRLRPWILRCMRQGGVGPPPGSQYDVLPPGEDDKQQSMVQEAKDITLHGKIQS